jgi:peptidoglycan/LPS O-acetylase OafA/YrhL
MRGTPSAIAATPTRPLLMKIDRQLLLDRIAFLGNATYSSYLIHFPIQLAMVIAIDAVGISRGVMMDVPALLFYLAFVVACSLIVYRWFERPLQDYFRGATAKTDQPLSDALSELHSEEARR